jgi:hypothetical protein
MRQPVASDPQAGNSSDGILAVMRKFNLPMTREQYIELAYFGEEPEGFGAELEEALPEQFRKGQ